VEILNVLAGVPVRDMEAAIEWYGSLLGREPDARPMDGLADWHLTDVHTLQLVLDADRAGGGTVTLQVRDIAAAREAAAGRGVTFEYDDTTSTKVKFAELLDPEGNAVAIVESRDGFDPVASTDK
jgi:glyoxylase I family protein